MGCCGTVNVWEQISMIQADDSNLSKVSIAADCTKEVNRDAKSRRRGIPRGERVDGVSGGVHIIRS